MPYQFTDPQVWVCLHFKTPEERYLVHRDENFTSFYLISLTTWAPYPGFLMLTTDFTFVVNVRPTCLRSSGLPFLLVFVQQMSVSFNHRFR